MVFYGHCIACTHARTYECMHACTYARTRTHNRIVCACIICVGDNSCSLDSSFSDKENGTASPTGTEPPDSAIVQELIKDGVKWINYKELQINNELGSVSEGGSGIWEWGRDLALAWVGEESSSAVEGGAWH